MLQLEQLVADPGPVANACIDFDGESLDAVYRIIWKAMNGRRKIAEMEADDLVQAPLSRWFNNQKPGRCLAWRKWVDFHFAHTPQSSGSIINANLRCLSSDA